MKIKQVLFERYDNKDYLGFYKGDDLLPLRVINFGKKIEIDLENLSISNLQKLANIFNLIANFFNDTDKTIQWFLTKNIELANFTPSNMIVLEKLPKLESFISTRIEENFL